MRLAYKQPSFSRYAYACEEQCLSPLLHNGDLPEEAKVAIPMDEDDQDGHFFYNHLERGGYFAA